VHQVQQVQQELQGLQQLAPPLVVLVAPLQEVEPTLW